MIYSLPALGKEALPLTHFPTRHQAFLFRACEYVPAERLATVLKTSVENVRRALCDMGLPDYDPQDIWLTRGRITIIRRMWHILPYEQLLELLDTDADTLARMMRDEDFLDVKLGEKPICAPVLWRELTAEETRQTQKIKAVMESLDLSGRRPFDFEYAPPRVEFSGKEKFSTRMIYAFSGLYQNAFDVDSDLFLPDEQLAAYRDLGINGIWTQGVLSQLVPFPFDPTVSAGYEKRLERVQRMTERLAKYGIKLYLYINEPRSMPEDFFKTRPTLRGHVRKGSACLCTSTKEVQTYLKDAVEQLCRAVPQIGGFFTITRSENMTNCYSHSGGTKGECTCPRCRERTPAEVIAGTIACISEGAHRVSRDIKVFAWSWQWNEFSRSIIRALPSEVILLSQSELDIPFEIGGVRGKVVDYSMSITGPGKRAREEWQYARECGLETGAKVQINTTWEASTVPAIPVSPSIETHMQALQQEGVQHLLLSWTLGGYPCRNIAAAAKYFYESCRTDRENPTTFAAEQQFVKAFAQFPFHIQVLYQGPQNAGPSTLLFETPTGYRSTMTCFAYDDLESWRSIYPAETFEAQFAALCAEWEKGLALLHGQKNGEVGVMAEACYCLFRSSLNQIRFIRAREESRFADAAAAARAELEIAQRMLSLMNQNAAIGYEAANHYYFSKGQIAEKIVNCRHIIQIFEKRAETV